MIVREPESTYEPAPAGVHLAVCVDVVDLGIVDTFFGPKPQLRVVWQIEEAMEDGRPFTAMQRYTPSLHVKSKLRQHLESWRGRSFTSEELNGFELENLIGVPCQLNLVHVEKDNKVYSNIAAVTPPFKGATIKPDFEAYTRVKDRDGYDDNGGGTRGFNEPDPVDDDPIPF